MTEAQATDLIAALVALTAVLQTIADWMPTVVRIWGEGMAPLRTFWWVFCAWLLWLPLRAILKRTPIWPKVRT